MIQASSPLCSHGTSCPCCVCRRLWLALWVRFSHSLPAVYCTACPIALQPPLNKHGAAPRRLNYAGEHPYPSLPRQRCRAVLYSHRAGFAASLQGEPRRGWRLRDDQRSGVVCAHAWRAPQVAHLEADSTSADSRISAVGSTLVAFGETTMSNPRLNPKQRRPVSSGSTAVERAAAEDRSANTLKGYLRKKSSKGTWQRRWFEASAHYLTYYKVHVKLYPRMRFAGLVALTAVCR